MTAIIALPDRICADRCLADGTFRIETKKIFETKIDGKRALFATAGDSRLTMRFECAIRVGNLTPEPDESNNDKDLSFEGVLVTHRGVTYYDKYYAPFEVEWVAIGSAANFMNAALLCGKTPEQAIELAAQHFDGVHLMGKGVHVERLKK